MWQWQWMNFLFHPANPSNWSNNLTKSADSQKCFVQLIKTSHQLNQAFLCLYLWLLSPTEFQKNSHFKVTLKTITKNQGMTNSMFFWLTLYIFSMLIPMEPDLDSTFDFCEFTTLTDDNKSLNHRSRHKNDRRISGGDRQTDRQTRVR